MTIQDDREYQLVTWGLTKSRLRDPLQPRHWLGLGKDDRDLLTAYVCERSDLIDAMWTDVPVGVIPVLDGDMDTEANRRVVAGKWPWRLDCILQSQGVWTIIEVKPDAGHEALGQILAYRYYCEIAIEQLFGCSMAVVTDVCHECARPIFAEYGIDVIEVGRVLGIT